MYLKYFQTYFIIFLYIKYSLLSIKLSIGITREVNLLKFMRNIMQYNSLFFPQKNYASSTDNLILGKKRKKGRSILWMQLLCSVCISFFYAQKLYWEYLPSKNSHGFVNLFSVYKIKQKLDLLVPEHKNINYLVTKKFPNHKRVDSSWLKQLSSKF